MHILLIHQAYATLEEPGGTRHHEFALHLAEKGHRVTVIASPISYLTGQDSVGDAENPRMLGNITIHRAYTYSALHRSFIHRVFSFFSFMISSFVLGLRVRDVDLVWGTSPPIFQGVTAWLLARVKRVPFLFEVRDLWPAFAVAVGVLKNPLLIGMTEWLERFLYHRADRMMVNSPGFIDHVQARGGGPISLVPNGASPEMFDPAADGAAFRAAHGLTDKFTVLYAGAHGISNDLGTVLQAAARLGDLPDVRIVLLGDGKEKANLQAQARSLGLENVDFIPPVPKTGMHTALAAADACIAILKPIEIYKTVYPNKVFDYLAAGRPVVMAMEGVIRDVVEAAGAGINVPPGDPEAMAAAIRRLAADPTAARRMGALGRAYIEENFDREKLAARLVRIFKELTAG